MLTLSVPFYVWGVLAPVRGLPFALPATASMVILPALVATLLTRQAQGAAAVRQLWREVGDVSRSSPGWLIAAAVTMPAAGILGFWMMHALAWPLPPVSVSAWTHLPALLIVFFAGAALEEIGWTGYATPRLEPMLGVVRTGALIGCVWAAWHVIPWWFGQGHTPLWVGGQAALSVLMRIVMVWIYSRGGRSLFASIVFHTMINVSYSLFPNNGSHYDPLVQLPPIGLLVGIIAWQSANRVKKQAS